MSIFSTFVTSFKAGYASTRKATVTATAKAAAYEREIIEHSLATTGNTLPVQAVAIGTLGLVGLGIGAIVSAPLIGAATGIGLGGAYAMRAATLGIKMVNEAVADGRLVEGQDPSITMPDVSKAGDFLRNI